MLQGRKRKVLSAVYAKCIIMHHVWVYMTIRAYGFVLHAASRNDSHNV